MSTLSREFLDVVAQSNTQDVHVGDLEWTLNIDMPADLRKYVKAIIKEANDHDRNYLTIVDMMFLRMYVQGVGDGACLKEVSYL